MRPLEDIVRIAAWITGCIAVLVGLILRDPWVVAVGMWTTVIASITDKKTNVLVTVVTEPDEGENSDGD